VRPAHRLWLSAERPARRGECHGGGSSVLNDRLTVVAQTGSTNADLLALAADWPEGRWLRAEVQTAGRGRMGRAWLGQPGNLHASTLIRLRPGDPPVQTLGLVIGVAVHAALAPLLTEGTLRLKWPNDLLIGGAKLAGLLLERGGDAVVIGIGVNVTHAPTVEGRAVTCVADHTDAVPGLDALTQRLADFVDDWINRWRGDGFAPARQAWLAAGHQPGDALMVPGEHGQHPATFFDLGGDGALLCRLADGRTHIVTSGDVDMA
jgi:BirA family transcriptional regulator, biotin operon repressor / biotin---[acetyl-CoA-carboxylase] ligase